VKEGKMESKNDEFLTVDVGGRLKQLRQERGLSMRAVARASGLSTNALSMIERSRTSPSVSTLYKISEALGIPITAFFRTEPQRKELIYQKQIEHKKILIPSGIWTGLGGAEYLGNIEPFVLTLDPGGCSGEQGLIHTGHEFVYCISGILTYEIEGETYHLDAGDNLIFSAQRSHQWCNTGNTTTIALIVITGFEQGESPSEFHVSAGLKGSLD